MDYQKKYPFTIEAEERLNRALQRPILYIAGPMMSHGNPLINVRSGVAAGKRAYELGWVPIVPHMDIVHQLITGDEDIDGYLTRDYAYIFTCDAVWFLEGWQESHGAVEEMRLVQQLRLPWFTGDCLPASLHMKDHWRL